MGEEGGGRESSRRARRKRKGEEKEGGGSALRRSFPFGLPPAPPCLSRSRCRRLSSSGASRARTGRASLGSGVGACERNLRSAPRRSGAQAYLVQHPDSRRQGQSAAPGKPSGRAQELPVRGALLGAPGVSGCQPSRLAAVGGSARATGGWSGEEWRRGERGEEGLGEGRRRG